MYGFLDPTTGQPVPGVFQPIPMMNDEQQPHPALKFLKGRDSDAGCCVGTPNATASYSGSDSILLGIILEAACGAYRIHTATPLVVGARGGGGMAARGSC